MESVKRAKLRIKSYPIFLSKCSKSASVYAACVTQDLNVNKNVCEKEFMEFKNCLIKEAKNLKLKL